jgi:restriction system protein
MARGSGIVADVLAIALRLPWWLNVGIAIGIYLALAPIATAGIPQTTGIKDAGDLVGAQMYKTLAFAAQIFLPLLFLVGAVISAARSLLDSSLLDRLISAKAPDFHTINWQAFERVVGQAFHRKGYDVEVTGGGGADGGVDLIARRDGKRYLVQCKHWRGKMVGVKPVRELYGVVAAENADGGFVVTSGRFTDEARRFAAGQAIYLMDGDDLKAVVRELNQKARPVGTAVAAPKEAPAPVCPRCHAPMVRRTAKKGPGAGTDFLGCSRFPVCKGTLSL